MYMCTGAHVQELCVLSAMQMHDAYKSKFWYHTNQRSCGVTHTLSHAYTEFGLQMTCGPVLANMMH